MERVNIQKARKFLLDREKSAGKEREKVRAETLGALRRAGNLFEEHGITRAWVYGSMAHGMLRSGSDVDVAVEGDVDFRGILALYSRLSSLLDRTVDVRSLEELPFGDSIRRKGILVYESTTAPSEE